MARRLTSITVERCGDPVTGLWCDHCLLPSGIAVVVAVGPVVIAGAWCHDCRRRL